MSADQDRDKRRLEDRGKSEKPSSVSNTLAVIIEPSLRPGTGEPRADIGKIDSRKSVPQRSAQERLQEASGLAAALGLSIAHEAIVPLSRLRPATLFGQGKVDELAALIETCSAGLAIIDYPVSPVQQRNLETAWKTKVLDRTGLILEIFGERAATREGRLQVELAHLSYQKSRLVRSWTHLDRQRGGFGFLGGPGETQIEADRRLIDERIAAIKAELETVKRTRTLHRLSRRRIPYPAIALIGYTNAGKSTLFNALTGATVVAKDMLFATLDPTMREVRLPGGGAAILCDTVGFISDLPTPLIAAFRATLEEVIEADIILHVRDITGKHAEAERQDVHKVLQTLGIPLWDRAKPIIEVWNKIDLADETARAALEAAAARSEHSPVLVSARTGEGLQVLLSLISRILDANSSERSVEVHSSDGALLHWLYEHARILHRKDGGDGRILLRIRISHENEARLERLQRQH